MIQLCRRVASSRWFQDAALAVIVANAVLIGVETSPSLWERHGGLFDALNAVAMLALEELRKWWVRRSIHGSAASRPPSGQPIGAPVG